jgi:hypothetical protein
LEFGAFWLSILCRQISTKTIQTNSYEKRRNFEMAMNMTAGVGKTAVKPHRHQAATRGRAFRQKDGKAGRLCTGFPTGNLTGRVED